MSNWSVCEGLLLILLTSICHRMDGIVDSYIVNIVPTRSIIWESSRAAMF